MKVNFNSVDKYITQENVNSLFEYIYQPKKIESHLTKFIIYDLETHNTDRTRPYVFCFYRLSKLAGRYNRNLSPYEVDKCKDTFTFDVDNCVTKALDFCLKLKGKEGEDSKNKFFGYNVQLHAHKGSGYDTWIVLNKLSCDRRIVNIIKNGKGFIELKVFIGYIDKKIKQVTLYLRFRSGMTNLNYSFKKLGNTFKLHKEVLKTGMNHDVVDGNNYKNKKDEWLDYVKQSVLCTAFFYARCCRAMEEKTRFSMEESLSFPGLRWKYFNSL